MERKTKLTIAKTAAIMSAIPFLLYAYEYGPDAGAAGVPGETGTCNQLGCHVGTAVNGGGGSVTVTFPGVTVIGRLHELFGTTTVPPPLDTVNVKLGVPERPVDDLHISRKPGSFANAGAANTIIPMTTAAPSNAFLIIAPNFGGKIKAHQWRVAAQTGRAPRRRSSLILSRDTSFWHSVP